MNRTHQSTFLVKLTFLSLILILCFPKCGFYIGKFPVSLSYMYLFLVGFILFLWQFQSCSFYIDNIKIIILFIANLFFFLWCFINTEIKNVPIEKTFFFVLMNLSIVPIAAFSLVFYFLNNCQFFKIKKIFIMSFYFVMIFGIAQFIASNLKHPIGIPYLTLTGHDFQSLLYGKDNNRGFIIKGFSTYGNGNIYGVCIALWAPIVAFYFRKNVITLTLFYSNLFLTFSRTIWIGLLIIFLIQIRSINKNNFNIVMFFFLAVFFIWIINGVHYGFLIDPALGGRITQIENIKISFFPGIYYKFIEITYLDVLQTLGIIGLLFFIALYFYPLFIRCCNNFSRTCKIGIFSYLVMMCSDGGYYNIPVGFVFWFVVSLMLQTAKLTDSEIHEKLQHF